MDSQINYDTFLLVIETHKGIIYKITNSFCRDPIDRQDLAQEIILRLWKSLANYQQLSKPSTWIYRIALNTAISYYRKEKSRRGINYSISEQLIQVADQAVQTQDPNLNLLQRFLGELKQLDRALIFLYLEEKTHQEIAEIMGITATNVATKIGRIKIILKEKFSQTPNL